MTRAFVARRSTGGVADCSGQTSPRSTAYGSQRHCVRRSILVGCCGGSTRCPPSTGSCGLVSRTSCSVSEINRFKGYRGVRQLRALAPLGDARAESPGESALRLHWYDAGLPKPELQVWIHSDTGSPIYRLDIADPEVRYSAEYDGEEVHTSAHDREYDESRRLWIEDHRAWTIDPFQEGRRLRTRCVPGRTAAGRPRPGASEHQPVDATSSYGLKNCPLSAPEPRETARSASL